MFTDTSGELFYARTIENQFKFKKLVLINGDILQENTNVFLKAVIGL